MSIGGHHLVLAFLLSVAIVEVMRRLSPRFGLVDSPTLRKAHVGLVPLCGGVAMFVAFGTIVLARWLVAGWPSDLQPAETIVLIVMLGVLVAIGVVDDFLDLGAGKKLVVQIFAAVALLFASAVELGGFRLIPFGSLVPVADWIALVVTIVFIVGVTNAFNMLDGLDGLAGGVAAIALGWLAVAGIATGRLALVEDSLLLLAVVLGFLTFNLRSPWLARAVVFMGDAGSLMLGFALACFIVDLSASGAASADGPDLFPALLWLVALPVIDTISLMVRRAFAGQNPMAADRRHLHHLVVQAGLSPARAATILLGVSACLGAIGAVGILFGVAAHVMLLGLLIPVAAHCALVRNCSERCLEAVEPQSLAPSPEAAE